jgi:hypothetical protein
MESKLITNYSSNDTKEAFIDSLYAEIKPIPNIELVYNIFYDSEGRKNNIEQINSNLLEQLDI